MRDINKTKEQLTNELVELRQRVAELEKGRILLADEDELFRIHVRHMLEHQEDMEIVGDCTSADEATSQIETLSPNIVLMDAQLPGMNGIETCRHLTGNGDDCDVTMLSTCQELISDALKLERQASSTIDHRRADRPTSLWLICPEPDSYRPARHLVNLRVRAYNGNQPEQTLIVIAKPGGKTMAEEFLVAQDLHKSFNEHKAVNGVSFTIHKGEIFGLLGPNGAGKTTTIRMLSTVLEPNQGDATLGGYSIRRNADAVRRLIGVCPQELALYEQLSALDNMVFFGRMAGLNGKEARTQAMAHLQLMGLVERAKGKVEKFSGGMKRRINLAIALMGHPELLFLDEPTVGIDPQSRNNIYENIGGLRDNGMTILYTTHYMEEADRLCDRVAIMDGGQIIAMDTPHRLKSQIGSPEQVTLEDVFLKLTGRSLRD